MAFTDTLSQYLQAYADQQSGMQDMGAGNVKPKSTTINYNDDGSFDMTHKQTIAPVSPDQVAQPVVQPVAQPQPQFEPYQVAAVGQTPPPPQRAVPQPMPARPVDPNAYIAQQESGNNPNIGYHYPANAQGQRQSSAYGTYGITAPAYRDVQRAEPAFQGRDITSLSPEEQTRANDVYRGEQQKQLTAFGVDPTPENLRLSQFLGAKGAADYLRDGTISPAAAKANGGEDKVRQIADARLAGTAMPTSGAAVRQPSPVDPNAPQQVAGPAQFQAPAEVGPPLPLNGNVEHDTLLTAGNDPKKLSQIAYGDNYSPATREAAQVSLRNVLYSDTKMAEAQNTIKKSLEGGDTRKLANELKNTEGSYVKAALLKMAGLDKASDEELYKMGVGATWMPAQIGDKEYSVYSTPRGDAISAIDRATGERITDPTVLSQLNGQGTIMNKSFLMPQTSGSPVTKTINGQLVNGIQIYDPVSKKFYVQFGNQRDTNPQGWTSSAQNVEQQAVLGKQKAQIDLYKKFEGATMDAKFKYIEDTNKALVGKYGADAPIITPEEMGLTRPGLPGAGGVARPGAVAPVAPGAVAPVAPGAVRPNVAAGTNVAGGEQVVAGGRPTLSGMQQEKAQQEQDIKTVGARSKAFNEYLDTEVAGEGRSGDTIGRVRRQQFGILNRPGVDSNKLFGLYNAAQESPNEQKFSIIRDIFGGMFKPEAEVSKRLAELNLDPATRSALEELNISNQEINAATLKKNAGAGSVSNAEQEANNKSNVKITEIPALGGYNALAQSQFKGDLLSYRSDWAGSQPAKNTIELDKAWRKEEKRMADIYGDIAKKRIEFINKNGNTTDAVKRGYQMYPVPEYDPSSGSWKKTKSLAEIMGGR